MYKDFATDDQPRVIEANDGRAFHFFERSEKITKSASDAVSREVISRFMPDDHHFGVHLVSMGAEEDYGHNRNADSASRHSLRTYHPTFEKFGHVYREHLNKNPKTQGIGNVVHAAYNERMHRGELLIHINKDKAPDLYKKARARQELSWSMSMRLPFDRCSCCDKKSRDRTQYCGHLKSGSITKYLDAFEKYAYARNEDDVKFFDISEVKRRADRIATYLNYQFSDGDMAKAAAEGDVVISGADWADFYGRNDTVTVAFTPWESLTLSKLAKAIDFVRQADPDTRDVIAASVPRALSRANIEILAQPDFRSVGGELAKKAMVLSFADFASIITGVSVEELRKKAEFSDVENDKVPGLAGDMEQQDGACCGEALGDMVAPDVCGTSFSPEKDSIDTLIKNVGDDLGMTPSPVTQRTITITIKSASLRPKPVVARKFDPYYEGMANAYGFYLVKAAHQVLDNPHVSENLFMRTLAGMQLFPTQKDC